MTAVHLRLIPLATCFVSVALSAQVHSQSPQRPNVLFLAVDDMKDWVGCLGGYEGKVHTPNIDRLADQAMLFTNAHCPSPKCAPSRAALMTGLRPSTTGLYDNGHWWLPNVPDVVTIPTLFRRHGYQAVGAGKIFHHTAGNHPPNQWNEFQRITFRNDPWFRGSKLNYPWSDSGPYPDEFPYSGVSGLGHENDWGSLPINDADYDDARSVRYARSFLARQHERPFFLACGIFRPHLPWYVPQRFFDLYPLDEVVVPTVRADDLDDVPEVGRSLAKARRDDLKRIRDADRWRHAVRAYLASISYADAQLGHVLEALYASQYDQQTIVVLWSDHGWHLGGKSHWHKSTLWEEATRVPLVIRTPDHPPGKCDRPVSLIDLYPTLVELCQLESTAKMDGLSLAPLMRDPNAPRDRPAVIEFRRGNAAVRSDRYRYIRYSDGGEELYDHIADPLEWNNLIGDPAYDGIKKRLGEWIASEWASPALTKNAFRFDHDAFEWTHRESGRITRGK